MRIYTILFLILFLTSATDIEVKERPTGLMIEFIREPADIRILDLNPEFTWVVPQSAIRQTAFQILIASTKENLDQNNGDIWDSRKSISSRSSEVEYSGQSLLPITSYYWKVKIWDSENRPSEYSETMFFTTGNPHGYVTTANKFSSALISPERIIKVGNHHFFIDFGKDAFGTLILDIIPEKVDTLTIYLGEKISGLNKIDRNPGGSIRYQKVLMPLRPGINHYSLNLPPDARNIGPAAVHLPDSIGVITPFRYCEIEKCSFDLKSDNVAQKAYNYYFNDEMSDFTSSDTVLNQVWNISKYSMKATSFAGKYIDGDRERIPYEADAYINQLGHYYTDREYSMGRVTSEYFIYHPTWPTEWILHTVLLFYNDFMFTGNAELLNNYFEKLKYKTLTSLSRDDGLISSQNVNDEIMKNLGFSNVKERIRDIVDWPPAQKDTGWKLATSEGERDGYELVPINTVVNAFYYRNLVLMSEIARVLGKKSDLELYTSLATKVRESFNNVLLDKTTGVYTDGESSKHSSLHANMMPLVFGLVPDEYKKSVIRFIKSRGMACSVYGSQYLLEGLYNEGEADYALSLLTSTGDRSWWNMIRSGSTITMEAWDMKYKPNSDWNHAWGAAPANIIPGYMWGISPAAPGFSKAFIRPQLASLTESKIMVPTIRGNIIAEYKTTGTLKEYTISIPGNMECDFIIPGTAFGQITVNGKKFIPFGNSIKLTSGITKIKLSNKY
jgi:alpha-L-rhamnosidase